MFWIDIVYKITFQFANGAKHLLSYMLCWPFECCWETLILLKDQDQRWLILARIWRTFTKINFLCENDDSIELLKERLSIPTSDCIKRMAHTCIKWRRNLWSWWFTLNIFHFTNAQNFVVELIREGKDFWNSLKGCDIVSIFSGKGKISLERLFEG